MIREYENISSVRGNEIVNVNETENKRERRRVLTIVSEEITRATVLKDRSGFD